MTGLMILITSQQPVTSSNFQVCVSGPLLSQDYSFAKNKKRKKIKREKKKRKREKRKKKKTRTNLKNYRFPGLGEISP